MAKHKLPAALALAFAAASAAFADIEFTNIVSADGIKYTWLQNEDDDWKTASGLRLGDFREAMEVKYTSKRLDFGANAEVTLSRQYNSYDFYYNDEFNLTNFPDYFDEDGKVKTNKFFDVRFTDFDLFLRYRPFKYLSFFLSDDIFADGAYLPVARLNMASGNMGSDLGLMVTPFNNFKVTLGLDVASYIMADKDADSDIWLGDRLYEKLPELNVGAHWNNRRISAGVAGRNLLNMFTEGFGSTNDHEGSIGAYAAFRGTGWVINVGGAYNNVYDYKWSVNNQYPNAEILGFINQYRVEGKVLGTIGLSAWNEKLSVDFDLVTNVGMDKDDPFSEGDTSKWDLRTRRARALAYDSASSKTQSVKLSKTYAHYYSGFDLYAGLRGSYKFTPAFKTDIVLKGVADFNPASRYNTSSGDANGNTADGVGTASNAAKSVGRGAVFEVNPSVSYTWKWHTWSFGFDVVYADPYVTLSIPMSWKYVY